MPDSSAAAVIPDSRPPDRPGHPGSTGRPSSFGGTGHAPSTGHPGSPGGTGHLGSMIHGRLSHPVAFAAVTAIFMLFAAASSAPSPLSTSRSGASPPRR